MMDILLFLLFGTLAGIGAGNAGLPICYLVLWREIEQTAAQGLSLLLQPVASSASLLNACRKVKVSLFPITAAILGGILGALGGTALFSVCRPGVLRKIFAVFTVSAGVYSFFTLFLDKKPKKNAKK